jgi:hypothetical protein
MHEAYIQRLRREAEERRARRRTEPSATATDSRAELRARITRWYNALAPEDRAPRYLLEHLAPLFRCTPQQLGVALHELGWRRKRVWRDDGPYRRYWLPPAPLETNTDTFHPETASPARTSGAKS